MQPTAPFVKLERGALTEDLIGHPFAFALLSLIALRARRSDERRLDGLVAGEAFIGDYDAIGATRQQHRTALDLLRRAQFVTTRTTNKGTIARLTESAPYDINEQGQQPAKQPRSNQQPTNKQPPTNQQPTTNEEGKKERREEVEEIAGADAPAQPLPAEQPKEEPKKRQPRAPRPVGVAANPPTEAEVAAYVQEYYPTAVNATEVATAFIAHYTANGWKTGKGGLPMQDWRAGIRGIWKKDVKHGAKVIPLNAAPAPAREERPLHLRDTGAPWVSPAALAALQPPPPPPGGFPPPPQQLPTC